MTTERINTLINRNVTFSSNQKNTLREAISASVDLAGWRDMTMPASTSFVGQGTPTLAAWGPSANIKQYQMAVNDSLYFIAHVDHDYLRDSLAYFHVHFSTSGTNVQPVKWEINYSVAKGHGQEAFPEDSTFNLTQAGSSTAWMHQIVEDTAGIDLKETDALFLVEVKRVTNGGTENTDNVFLHTCDLHYQVGQHATPNRAPDFFE